MCLDTSLFILQTPGDSEEPILFLNGANAHAVPAVLCEEVADTHAFSLNAVGSDAVTLNEFFLDCLGTTLCKLFVECERTIL